MDKELKAKVLKAMQVHKFNMGEAGRAVSFVEDLLMAMVEQTKANEPHATISIEYMEDAVKRVSELYEVLEETQGYDA